MKNCDIIIENYSSNKWVKEVLPLKRFSKEVLKAILTCNVLKYERPCSRQFAVSINTADAKPAVKGLLK